MVLTEEGSETLARFMFTLARVYIENPPENFPLDMEEEEEWITVLGLPRMKYQFRFTSKEELYGRIVAYAHLLGVEEIIGKGREGKVVIKL